MRPFLDPGWFQEASTSMETYVFLGNEAKKNLGIPASILLIRKVRVDVESSGRILILTKLRNNFQISAFYCKYEIGKIRT